MSAAASHIRSTQQPTLSFGVSINAICIGMNLHHLKPICCSEPHTLPPEYYYSWFLQLETASSSGSQFMSLLFVLVIDSLSSSSLYSCLSDLCSSVWWSFSFHLCLCCFCLLLQRKTALIIPYVRGNLSPSPPDSFFNVFQHMRRNINSKK